MFVHFSPFHSTHYHSIHKNSIRSILFIGSSAIPHLPVLSCRLLWEASPSASSGGWWWRLGSVLYCWCLFMVSQHLSIETWNCHPSRTTKLQEGIMGTSSSLASLGAIVCTRKRRENSKDYNIANLKWSIKIRREIHEHIHSTTHAHHSKE